MDFNSVGRDLLEKVHEVEMDEFVRQMCKTHNSSGTEILHIESLDQILNDVMPHKTSFRAHGHQSAVETLPPSEVTQSVFEEHEKSLARSTVVIEFTSLTTGAGKTYLMYLIAAHSVLPAEIDGYKLRGKNAAIVIIDPENRFDVETFADVMAEQVKLQLQHQNSSETANCETKPSTLSVQDIVDRALIHVHLFRPQSLASFLATLRSVKAYLLDSFSHQSSNRRLGAIYLDGLSTFYWQHRTEEDAKSFERRIGKTPLGSLRNESPTYLQLLDTLVRTANDFMCTVVFTSQSVLSQAPRRQDSDRERELSLRPLLPPKWQSYADARFLLDKVKVIPFAPDMTAREAWVERRLRQDVVERGRIRVQLLRDNTGHGFEFAIRDGKILLGREETSAPEIEVIA